MNWKFTHELSKEFFCKHEDITLSYLIFEEEIITKETVNLETIREVYFKKCKLNNVHFNDTFLGKVKFENCELNNVTFSGNSWNNVYFSNCKLIDTSIFECTINNIIIEECLIEYSKIENTKLDNGKIDDTKLMENIHRHNKYIDILFYKCQLISENFIDTNFKNCDLKTSHFEEVKINLDDLIGSKLSLLNLLEIVNSKGIIIEE